MARTPKRRGTLSALALTAASALLLTGCSAGGDAPAQSGPVTLEFWGWAPGLETAVELWNGEHPETQIDFFRMRVPNSWVEGPSYDLAQDALKDAFAQVANGELTFAEALTQVQESTVQDLTDMGLSVK